jgi:hypothetical protein
MHNKEPLIYQKVTAEHFAALEKLAQSHNLSVVGNSGRTQKDGYDVEWNFVEDTETLTIKVIQSPWYMPERVIEEHFDSWVAEAKPQTAQVQVAAEVDAMGKTDPKQVPSGAGIPVPDTTGAQGSQTEKKAPISPA